MIPQEHNDSTNSKYPYDYKGKEKAFSSFTEVLIGCFHDINILGFKYK